MRLKVNKKFSLIIPTRGRIASLNRCLRSFFDKAKDASCLECVMLADFDDKAMMNFGDYINEKFSGRVIFGNRSAQMIQDYNNYGAQCSTGKYIWMLNDDYEMTMDNWDEFLENKIEEFLLDKPDRIVYVHLDDSTHTNWGVTETHGCCCPVLTHETVDTMNSIMPNEIDMWGADIALFQIFKSLPYNRILDVIKDLRVLHHCRHNNTAKVDDNSRRIEKISKRTVLTDKEFQNYVKLLTDRIKNEL